MASHYRWQGFSGFDNMGTLVSLKSGAAAYEIIERGARLVVAVNADLFSFPDEQFMMESSSIAAMTFRTRLHRAIQPMHGTNPKSDDEVRDLKTLGAFCEELAERLTGLHTQTDLIFVAGSQTLLMVTLPHVPTPIPPTPSMPSKRERVIRAAVTAWDSKFHGKKVQSLNKYQVAFSDEQGWLIGLSKSDETFISEASGMIKDLLIELDRLRLEKEVGPNARP